MSVGQAEALGGRVLLIVWSSQFPKHRYLPGYLRLKAARHRFGERLGLAAKVPPFTRKSGDMARLEALRGTCAGKDIVVLGNGPSLNSFDPELLKGRVSIGANGVYEMFPEWGHATDYLLIEDVEQAERRGKAFRDVPSYDGRPVMKLAAMHTAHAIPKPWRDDLCFFNARYMNDESYYSDWGPFFSKDFAGTVWLGSTVTYISLQLAWYLGAETVYLAGVDFSYGELENYFPPGKLVITEDNLPIVQKCHFTTRYHNVGDIIGVPHTSYQKSAYSLAKETFEADGRQIINLTPNTALDVFETRDMASVIKR